MPEPFGSVLALLLLGLVGGFFPLDKVVQEVCAGELDEGSEDGEEAENDKDVKRCGVGYMRTAFASETDIHHWR